MKHPNIGTKPGRIHQRSKGNLDWAWMMKRYHLYRNHIFRVRRNPAKLIALKAKFDTLGL